MIAHRQVIGALSSRCLVILVLVGGGVASNWVGQSALGSDRTRIIENLGQWDSCAQFYLDTGDYECAFDEGGVRVLLNGHSATHDRPGVLVEMRFVDPSERARVGGDGLLPGYYNYFRGDDPSRWRSYVMSYSGVRYAEIYPGVDNLFRLTDQGQLAYDLLLSPGSDLEAIRIECLGVDRLSLSESGELLWETAAGTLTQTVPIAWQIGEFGEQRPVECRFELLGQRTFGFRAVTPVDPGLALTIDPVLEFATFLGADRNDLSEGIASSATGSVVVAGGTCAHDVDSFPTTPGAFDTTPPSPTFQCDAYVTRFSPDGSTLEFSTFFGGVATDEATAIAVDPATEELIVVGFATSPDLPTTAGAYQQVHANPFTTFARARDVFVARFTSDGAALVYSTFVGGEEGDRPNSMALAPGGDVVVVGGTNSPDFPVSASAPRSTLVFGVCAYFADEGFIFRLSGDGSALVHSTYIGGNDNETVWDVALDPSGAAYLCGGTASPDFPVTPGAFDSVRNMPSCSITGFVLELSSAGDAILRSTLLENSATYVELRALRLDGQGRPVVAGTAVGPGLPTTPNAYVTSEIGDGDGVVVRFDPTLSMIDYGSYFGSTDSGVGQGYDQPTTLGVLSTGVVVIAGNTNGGDFPVTVDALQPTHGGTVGIFGLDGFLLALDLETAGAGALVYSTFLGGASSDWIEVVDIDSQDRIAAAMRTQSQATLAGSPGAFMESGYTVHPSADAYVLRLRLSEPEFRRGDANGDGTMNIADAIAVLGSLFGGEPFDCRDSSDGNDDGNNDIADAVFVLSALFSQGALPPGPGPLLCGIDPTADSLGCIQYASCP